MMNRYGQGREKWTGDFAIVACSTIIRQEALAILYARGYFGFDQGRATPTFQHERSDIPFVDHISRIRFSFDVYIDDDDQLGLHHVSPEENDNTSSKKTAAPVSFFTGTDIMRKSCVIRLTFCTPKFSLLLESPFFHAISRLDGFNTVTLIFDSDNANWQAHDPDSTARIQFFPDFATLFNTVISALEPTLGASSSIEFEDYGPQYHPEMEGEVTFHPQDHLAKQRVQKESNS